MKLETILNAMLKADKVISECRCRQYDAFRARILRMDAVGKSINADLNTELEMIEAGYTGL